MNGFARNGMIAMGLALILAWPGTSGARAQEPLEGFVIAREACDATLSIRGGPDRQRERLVVDRAYKLIGENRRDGSHYQVEIPGADPAQRWIAKTCGERVRRVETAGEGPAPAHRRDPDAGSNAHRDLVLAISWQPAFCETRPGRPECRSQRRGRFDADNFSLHGLWPQPRGTEYCGVAPAQQRLDKAGRWSDLAPLPLEPDTAAALAEAMPGARSALDRHEWLRHGTCYRADAEEYFADSLIVLGAINASPVRRLFAGAIGREVRAAEIRDAFDAAFGRGAGQRVRVGCVNDGGRRIVRELIVGLKGEITPEADVGALIRAAPRMRGGCAAGIVDPVGLQ